MVRHPVRGCTVGLIGQARFHPVTLIDARDGFISPLDLVEAGLHSAEEAAELHAMETRGAKA